MATRVPAQEETRDRPRIVSAIGWVWFVLSALLFLRSLVDIAVWRFLRPATPTLLGLIDERRPENRYVRPLLRYILEYKAVEAFVAAIVVVVAWRFLRLDRWARPALQAVCGFAIAYALAFATFWAWLWPKVAAQRAADTGRAVPGLAPGGLVVGIAVCVLVAAGLVWVIAYLSRPAVRALFANGRG